jgi:serine/threonine-protein kinase
MLVPDPAGPGGERVKLLDFGIAKLGAAHVQGEDVKTRTGQIMGTAAYMSPEQFGGHKPTDGQSDVYSLACLMFRLLSGQQPFVSDSGEMAVAAMHMFKPAPPLQTLVPDAAPWLVSLIDSMLRKEPTERPTMAEVAALLQEALPDYAQSRKSLPPFRLEVSGATRLRDLDLGTPDRGIPERGLPSKPAPELIAPTVDQPGFSGVSSQPGTITGATGQAGMPVPRRVGRGAVLLAAGLVLLSAGGVGGLLLWRHRSEAPRTGTAQSQVPTPPTAPTPPTTPPPTAPTPAATSTTPPAPAPVGAPASSTDNAATASPGGADAAAAATPESDPDQKTRRDRSAAKLGKPSKPGSRPDGRSRSKTPHATQIIN